MMVHNLGESTSAVDHAKSGSNIMDCRWFWGEAYIDRRLILCEYLRAVKKIVCGRISSGDCTLTLPLTA